MTATVLDVDSSVYYEAGDRLKTLAGEWFFGVDAFWSKLDECGNMTGSYSEAKKWAESYDARAAEALKMVSDLAYATFNYGQILINLGYNHALAEWTAAGSTGPAPQQPAKAFAGYPCRIPLPSAGGPGNGLIDGGVKLVEAIGITVPDGNADLLQRAADTWAAIADATPVTAMAAGLEAAALQFEAITSPEVSFIDEDIQALKAAAETTARVFRELSGSTRDHHDGLVEMRAKMVELLKELGEELLKELAISVAIAAASSVITFGIGAAVASARVVSIAAKMGRPIRLVIDAFKSEHNIAKGVRAEETLGKHADDVNRLKGLKADNFKAPPRASLTAEDEAILRQGVSDSRGNSLTAALRRGDATPEQQRQAEALTQAMNKLPVHEGPVVRQTNLRQELLDQYVPGQRAPSDPGFMSTSTNPKGANDFIVDNSKVEFNIESKMGRNYSQYGTPDEVLFSPNTQFQVLGKTPPDANGRVVITMMEI
ncbi:hypothetical protein [Nocardia anaemiae]|uniref:hypothetical protein n=1 Tax=Nocardia anaemiae TaxID=263910 RepID=UPI0007A54200|nr:hypothetical protein [Nocardia anaemiae]